MDMRHQERAPEREAPSAEIEQVLARLGQTPAHGDSAAAFAALLADFRLAVRRRRGGGRGAQAQPAQSECGAQAQPERAAVSDTA
jgi:hypothetical protein